MDNPEKLAIQATQDEEKHKKNILLRIEKKGQCPSNVPTEFCLYIPFILFVFLVLHCLDPHGVHHPKHIKRKLKRKPKGNKEWTIVRHWQHWLHKTQGEGQNKTNKDKHKEKTNTKQKQRTPKR